MKKSKSLKFTFVLTLGLLLISAAAIYSVWDVFRQIKLSARLVNVQARKDAKLFSNAEVIENFCLAGDDCVFRGIKWGMSLEEIKASERQKGSKLRFEEKDFLRYEAKFYNTKTDIIYNFDKETGLAASILVMVPSPVLGAENLEGSMRAFRKIFNEKYKRKRGAQDSKATQTNNWCTPETFIVLGSPDTKSAETNGLIFINYMRQK